MKNYKVIGVMSGSSLDGLDIAYCHFENNNGKWNFEIIKAVTLNFDAQWKQILKNIKNLTATETLKYHTLFGKHIGYSVKKFINENGFTPVLISSHGHTVFHNPAQGYTFQLGHGQAIATTSGITTVSDFRIKDIIAGGEGAPLVPIGDLMLFPQYEYCLNLGGIANISFQKDGKRIGFDICPANQLLNYLSRQLGKPYDINGNFAQLGKMHKPLFDKLNETEFYKLEYPKSLSNEYIENNFFEILDSFAVPVEDKLYTTVKHIAFQINRVIENRPKGEILVTGGGAHNIFLINALRFEKGLKFVVPENNIVNFKESLIFALMGILRLENKINCLSGVTGASIDTSAGTLYYP
jgi:anhydro-N-acetylmuramic acid kinase